jgi:hypothetical protein
MPQLEHYDKIDDSVLQIGARNSFLIRDLYPLHGNETLILTQEIECLGTHQFLLQICEMITTRNLTGPAQRNRFTKGCSMSIKLYQQQPLLKTLLNSDVICLLSGEEWIDLSSEGVN